MDSLIESVSFVKFVLDDIVVDSQFFLIAKMEYVATVAVAETSFGEEIEFVAYLQLEAVYYIGYTILEDYFVLDYLLTVAYSR